MTPDKRAAELRQLKRDLATAGDSQVRRLVALVDGVQVRGEADALIAPLRPRLAVLRPPRPLSFPRLMFLPLNPLILPPSAWRPGSAGIPRVTLRTFAGMVAAGMGTLADAPLDALDGHDTGETAFAASAGAQLWPRAAVLLGEAGPPAGWTEATGLPVAEFAPLARSLSVLLSQGVTLWHLAHAPPPGAEGCEALLDHAAAGGPLPLSMMLALLLARMPQAGHLLHYADTLAATATGSSRVAPDRALDFLLGGMEESGETADVDGIRRAALLLETLIRECQRKPTRAARLDDARRQLDETCRTTFQTTASALTPALAAEPGGLEASARYLRRVDAVGRRLGSTGFYDTTLRDTAARLTASPGLSRTARLRLAEILLGPDAAVAMASGF